MQRFPQLNIIQGDACELHRLIRHSISDPIQAIVSSLPLRTLSSSFLKKMGMKLIKCCQKEVSIFNIPIICGENLYFLLRN